MSTDLLIAGRMVAELRALCDAAAPGPWTNDEHGTHVYRPGPDGANICSASNPQGSQLVGYVEPGLGDEGLTQAVTNARFIAAARTALPEALDLIERLTAENFSLAAGLCNVPGGLIGDEYGNSVCTQKARAEKAEAALARCREALLPFTNIDWGMLDGAPDYMFTEDVLIHDDQPTVGDFRRARAALAETERK